MANSRWAWFGLLAALPLSLVAQDRLRTMPGYESFKRVENEGPLVRGGALAASWVDANTIEYSQRGKHYRFDVTARRATEAESAEQGSGERARPAPPATELPERGRQFTTATSPDGRLQARYRDRNVWLGPANGGDERAVTTDGSTASRVKDGTASWVYGEELEQHSAMWWSPDSRKLAFYRFDESRVADYLRDARPDQETDHRRRGSISDRGCAQPGR